MRKTLLQVVLALTVLSMILSACAAPPTEAPEPTEAPATEVEVTEAPATEAPEATEAPATEAPTEPFTFGMLLVGPYNDHGWSQAHYEAGLYVEENLGAEMIYLDKVNPADRPGTTPDQLAEELVDQGAKLIIFNSGSARSAATNPSPA
jgi:simple sugar transport system substrate-binding protein